MTSSLPGPEASSCRPASTPALLSPVLTAFRDGVALVALSEGLRSRNLIGPATNQAGFRSASRESSPKGHLALPQRPAAS